MRRPGVGFERRVGGARMGPALRQPLMDWSVDGTFSRASVATARPTPSTIRRYNNNERRFENGRILLEGSPNISRARYSEEIDNAAWVKTNCTVSANAVPSPDGTLNADRITTTLDGAASHIYEATATVPTGSSAFSFFVRGDSSFTGSFIFTSDVASSSDISITDQWQQITGSTTGTVVAPTLQVQAHALAGTGVAGRNMYVWGVMIGTNNRVQSYMTTTSADVTRQADSLTYSAGTWNTHLASLGFSFEFAPVWDNTAMNQVLDLLSFGGGNDRFAISNADVPLVVVGGATIISGSAITWSRDQVLRFTINPAAGYLTVAGATSGNGTFSGTPWSWPTAVTLRAGGRVSSTAECNGALSNPYAL